MKLNVAAGPDILDGWFNMDLYPQNSKVMKGDILSIPLPDRSCETVMANYVFEHLNFVDEPKAFSEVTRVLKPRGELIVKVPDFEDTVKKWLAAEDSWKCFYKLCKPSDPSYGFGHGFVMDQRWGVIMTHIFGSFAAPGLVHQNAYTYDKLLAIFSYLKLIGTRIETVIESDRGYDIKALVARGFKND